MTETQPRKIFSLLDVTQSIQRTLAERYGSVFWVKAEMNKLNHYPHSGHCYPDLVEKKDGRVIAQLRSTLWKDDYNRINHNFLKLVRTPLKDGITMLFCARILFDPVHGLSLRIMDIDPVFSLGELEREKQETIDALKEEGIFDLNKSLKMPLLPQRIAIISVETSKGYADFQKVINGSEYKFFHVLFPSLLQGERAVESMLYQLKRIRKVITHFDVVAIIRGGGGEVGLSCFNNLVLSREIARFPIPVLTGIGHATNETVAEMISFRNAITPTALANFLLEKFHTFADPVERATEKIVDISGMLLLEEKRKIGTTVKYFKSVTENILIKGKHNVQRSSQLLVHGTQFLIHKERDLHKGFLYDLRKGAITFASQQQMQIGHCEGIMRKETKLWLKRTAENILHLEKSVNNMSPDQVLKRGYSITRLNGKTVKSVDEIQPRDLLQTIIADGTITSRVIENKNSHVSNEE